jgi:hypothetical protein
MHTDEGYLLKNVQGVYYVIIAVFIFFGIVGIWAGFSAKEDHSGFLWGVISLVLAVLSYFSAKGRKVYIQPQKKQIQVKILGKIKTYPFSEFLNFQKMRVGNNGFTTQWKISVYMNENGKNRNIVLGVVGKQKTADKLIDETSELLNMGRENNNNVLSINTNIWR